MSTAIDYEVRNGLYIFCCFRNCDACDGQGYDGTCYQCRACQGDRVVNTDLLFGELTDEEILTLPEPVLAFHMWTKRDGTVREMTETEICIRDIVKTAARIAGRVDSMIAADLQCANDITDQLKGWRA